MRLTRHLLSSLPLVLSTLACGGASQGTDNSTFYFPPDCSPKAGFENYGLNHFSIVVSNLDAALNFYSQAFGLVHIFTFSPISKFKTAYMGHNVNNYPSCQAWTAQSTGSKGNIEFLYLENPSSSLSASTVKPNTFSHIGVFTPDVAGTCNRVASLGGKVIKPAGEYIASLTGPIANAYGLSADRTKHLSDADKAALLEGFKDPTAGIKEFCFATDLDGNLLEIQPVAAS